MATASEQNAMVVGENITNSIRILPIALPKGNDQPIRFLHYGVPMFLMQGTVYYSNNTAKHYDIAIDLVVFLGEQRKFLKDGEKITYVDCYENERGEVVIPKIKGLTKYEFMNSKW